MLGPSYTAKLRQTYLVHDEITRLLDEISKKSKALPRKPSSKKNKALEAYKKRVFEIKTNIINNGIALSDFHVQALNQAVAYADKLPKSIYGEIETAVLQAKNKLEQGTQATIKKLIKSFVEKDEHYRSRFASEEGIKYYEKFRHIDRQIINKLNMMPQLAQDEQALKEFSKGIVAEGRLLPEDTRENIKDIINQSKQVLLPLEEINSADEKTLDNLLNNLKISEKSKKIKPSLGISSQDLLNRSSASSEYSHSVKSPLPIIFSKLKSISGTQASALFNSSSSKSSLSSSTDKSVPLKSVHDKTCLDVRKSYPALNSSAHSSPAESLGLIELMPEEEFHSGKVPNKKEGKKILDQKLAYFKGRFDALHKNFSKNNLTTLIENIKYVYKNSKDPLNDIQLILCEAEKTFDDYFERRQYFEVDNAIKMINLFKDFQQKINQLFIDTFATETKKIKISA